MEPLALGFSPEVLWETWPVWRCALVAPTVAAALAQAAPGAGVRPEAQWEHDAAQGLSFADFHRASCVRSAFQNHLQSLLERFDVPALPVAQCWPFEAGLT